MGGGPSSNSSSTTTSPWSPLQGPILNYLSNFSSFINSKMNEYPQNLPRQGFAGINPLEQNSLFGIQHDAKLLNPLNATDTSLINDTLSGKYLNPDTNPYLAQTFKAASQQLNNDYTNTAGNLAGQFIQGGNAGGSAMESAEDQARFNFGNNEQALAANIYGTNYQDERNRMLQEQGMLPQLEQASFMPAEATLGAGQFEQQNLQNLMNNQYQNAQNLYNAPFSMMDMLGSNLARFAGMGGNSVSVSPNTGGKGI